MLILCGSVSSWIEKNIISSTLFLGRPSLYMTLKDLSLPECNQFWGKYADRISSYDKLKVLSVTGGVPRYLELINPNISAEDNIRALCFTQHAPLLEEFTRIFSDIFGSRSELYKKIIHRLLLGAATQEEILLSCDRKKTGDFSEYLLDLEMAGFISRDFTGQLKTGTVSKLSQYRLKDNYVRFYLKYIEPNREKIKKGVFQKSSLSSLSGWEGIIALQFESLVLNNDMYIIDKLGISLSDVVFSNPFFQRKTKDQLGCQVDLLIQAKFNVLYIVEIKFSRSEIPLSIVDEVKQKIRRIRLPRNFSYHPVLIHVNGVHESVVESGYFSSIIDFGAILS